MRSLLLLVFCALPALLSAQAPDVSVQTVQNYAGWGWNAIVMQNDLITFATVPAIGGRVMKYDLAGLSSIFVNPAEIGKTYTPSQNAPWHNFGGFKTWPAPQSLWNAGGWPPPPVLDFASYSFQIDTLSPPGDSAAVSVSSPMERWFAPNIRFERRALAFRGTSRIRMDQTIVNVGPDSVQWSVWGVTQAIVTHPGKTDYQNFWVYFPINPESHFGAGGVSPQGPSRAWKGEVAPGVYGVQYSPDNQKIFGDPHRGWIAYVNALDSAVFARTFTVYAGQQYPDDGSRVAVYVGGATPPYLEVEVMSPSVGLAPNGGSYTFTENWWAARATGPILDVDSVGAVTGRLSYSPSTNTLSGFYGVFYDGTARVALLDDAGRDIAEGTPHAVTPLAVFRLQETIEIPGSAAKAEVRLYDRQGGLLGVLDTAGVARLLSGVAQAAGPGPQGFSLAPGYPNPFNGGTVLKVFCPRAAEGSLRIYDVLGRVVAVLKSGTWEAGEHRLAWNPAQCATGIYVALLELSGVRQARPLAYVR